MVNVRLLKSLIREHLDNKDLCGPYMMSLHDYQGRTLYEYIPPTMVNAKRWEERNTGCSTSSCRLMVQRQTAPT